MYARSAIALAALLFTGCTIEEPQSIVEPPVDVLPLGPSALEDATHATGSTPLTASGPSGMLFSVNPDAGTLTRLDPATEAHIEVDVGAEPSRVAVAGNRVYVTLRGERSVVMLDAQNLAAGVQSRVEVGAEPVGIVAREDGQRVFVALSQEDAIVELDGATLAPLNRFSVSGEPRYLALHPSGGSLFVGSGRGIASLTRISMQTGEMTPIAIPPTTRFGMDGAMIDLVPRITGDLWVTPDGSRVLVPVLYADTTTPISDVAIEPGEPVPPVEPGVEGYGGDGSGVDKFTPAVIEVPVGAEGQPDDTARALFVSTTVFPPNGESMLIGSYITSVSASPDGERYLATMESSRAAVLIDPAHEVFGMPFDFAETDGGDGLIGGFFTMPEEAGFFSPALATLVTGEGTNGAVFLGEGRAYVRNAFDDTVGELDTVMGGEILQMHAESGANFGEFVPAGRAWTVSDTPLGSQLQAGRSLFFSATERSMGSGGISCSTCHFEGRNDGITWTFESGVRQTPSLAGIVSETAPVTWTSDVASVADEADLTTRGRMGGEGLTSTQLDAIAAYVDWTRLPDTVPSSADAAAINRGRVIFQRPDVACAACHTGDRFTDNTGHTIRGVDNLNTPGLRGVGGTAPYLHDGSQATLRDVLEWARNGQMGNTSSLTASEMDDLESYLRSL